MVQGFADTGRLLTRHPDIRKVSLTGEVGTGKAVMSDAAATLKNVTLELGGKSPLIVFEDAKLDNAVSGALLGNFYSSGQVCSNATRVFVHASIKAAFLERLLKRVSAMRIGDPDGSADAGRPAGVGAAHAEGARLHRARPRRRSARCSIGGHRVTDGDLAKGYFVAPTVFDDCRDDMAIVREEIFGPVMSVLAFDDEDEVIERANATEFGLAAGVFTNDLTRGAPRDRAAAGRHLLDQSLQRHADRAAVRGREDVGSRARERARRHRALHAAEERLRRHGRCGRPLLTRRRHAWTEPRHFDYVIVGAGSAGCVLADRLSADGTHRVLLLEYGGADGSIYIQMPSALSIPMNMPKYNWFYHTEPEPHLDGRRMHTPRGKVLGGSSSINGLVYIRGNPQDFERWAQEGARGGRTATCCRISSAPSAARRAATSTAATAGKLMTSYGRMTQPAACGVARRGRAGGLSAHRGRQRLSSRRASAAWT